MARGRGFGLSSARGSGRGGSFRGFRGGGSWRGGRGRGRGNKTSADATPKREDDGTQLAERFERVALNDEIDEKLGFSRVQEGGRKEGWLVNMHPASDISPACAYNFLMGVDRLLLRTLTGLPDGRLLSFTLFKMMGECLSALFNTSLTFVFPVRCVEVYTYHFLISILIHFRVARKLQLRNG